MASLITTLVSTRSRAPCRAFLPSVKRTRARAAQPTARVPMSSGGGVADRSLSALCPATLAVTRVACLGDSLTRGDGAHERRPPREKRFKQRGNYPALLQDLLGPGYAVRNFGHGGASACNASDAPYAATRAYATARRWRADVVVLMLGTNDAKTMHWEGAACGGGGAYREGLRQLLRGLGVGEAPMLSGRGGAPAPMWKQPPRGFGQCSSSSFDTPRPGPAKLQPRSASATLQMCPGWPTLLALVSRRRVPPAVLLLQPPPILRERWGIARRLLRSVRRELSAFLPPPAAAPFHREGACARGRAYLMRVALSKPARAASKRLLGRVWLERGAA